MRQSIVTAGLFVALLALAAGPASAATLTVTQELHLTPETAGEIGVTRTFDVPDSVESITTSLPEEAIVTNRSGFRRVDDTTYEWTGETQSPSLDFTMPANRTGQARGPEAADGRLLYADVGDWAIVRRPASPTSWSYRGEAVQGEQRLTVDGPGVAGEGMAYLGPNEVETRSAHGQTVRLVVPGQATMAADREAVLDSLTGASDALRVGDRDEAVLAIAAPRAVDWAVAGIQTADADFYVVADQDLATAKNVWLHEYVHTRQDFSTAESARWVTEGSATYYAALLALEQGHIDFETFATSVERGEEFDDVTLASPGTWRDAAEYRKGALVAGELDRVVRRETENAGSLQAVLTGLNHAGEPVDAARLRSTLDDAGGTPAREAGRRYAETSATPSMWDRETHRERFGPTPARLSLSVPTLANETGYRAAGPYRNASIGGGPSLEVVTGESVLFDVTVRNTGGHSGPYAYEVAVDDEVRTSSDGTLAPGDARTERIRVAFDESGRRTIAVGSERIPVAVSEPARVRVTDLEANRSAVPAGDRGRLAAQVTNPAARPGNGTLTLTRDGEPVATQTVHLDGEGSHTVVFEPEIPATGAHRFAVGNQSVTVEGRSAGPTAAVGDGFGILVAVVGVLGAVGTVVAILTARRRAGG